MRVYLQALATLPGFRCNRIEATLIERRFYEASALGLCEVWLGVSEDGLIFMRSLDFAMWNMFRLIRKNVEGTVNAESRR